MFSRLPLPRFMLIPHPFHLSFSLSLSLLCSPLSCSCSYSPFFVSVPFPCSLNLLLSNLLVHSLSLSTLTLYHSLLLLQASPPGAGRGAAGRSPPAVKAHVARLRVPHNSHYHCCQRNHPRTIKIIAAVISCSSSPFDSLNIRFII